MNRLFGAFGWIRLQRDVGRLGLVTVLVIGGASLAKSVEGFYTVSQRGRAFLPGSITVARGDRVDIVNDDGDLVHHAYVDAPGFSFDSGDQQPGAKATIVFTKAGLFKVLCGIHPKMSLAVTVKE